MSSTSSASSTTTPGPTPTFSFPSNPLLTLSVAAKPTLAEQIEARKQAKLEYLHNNDKLNGRETSVMGANNGSKNTGHGENQQAGKLASAGAAITGLLSGLGS